MMNNALLASALGLSLVCVLGWWHQCRTGNAGHADVIWAFGTGAASQFYFLVVDGQVLNRLMAALLIGVWSLRLGWYIHQRLHGKPEDSRYRAMREALCARITLFHFFFFQAQGLLAWLFALPAWVIAQHSAVVSVPAMIAGVLVGVPALVGESVADRQLQAFRSNPA